jgi:hypothetical protein
MMIGGRSSSKVQELIEVLMLATLLDTAPLVGLSQISNVPLLNEIPDGQGICGKLILTLPDRLNAQD